MHLAGEESHYPLQTFELKTKSMDGEGGAI